MTSEEARKYLSGDISIEEVSQTPPAEDTPNPSEVSTPTGDEGGNPDNSQTQLETPTSSEDQTNQGNAAPAGEGAEEHNGDDGNPPEDDKNKGKQPGFLEGKKDNRLPYPKANHNGKSPKDLKEIKANEAFIRQKRKYQAKVGAMQSEIDSLKQQLLKYNAVDTESLKDKPEEMIDLKINKSTLDNQIKLLEKQRNEAIEEQANAEAQLIHQQRIDNCFTDEAEVTRYQTLLANGRDKFFNFLQKYDPENTILQYLDDSDYSPLLVQILMTNPNVLKKVVEIRNPINKAIELRSLENRILMDRKLRQVKGKSAAPAAKKLPSTGSQVGAGAGSEQNAVRDANYWRNYLQTH